MELESSTNKSFANTFTHSFTISERKSIIISGVVKIESFDNEEFLLETTMGFLNIKGENLEIVKLDTYQGSVNIKGRINALNYIEEGKKVNKEEGVLNRLFKWLS